MSNKLIFLFVLIFAFGVASAWTPIGDIDLKNYYSIDNGLNSTFELYFGNLSWNSLYSYPVACPAGTSITQLGDSVVCTAFVQENTNVTFDNLNVTGIAYLRTLNMTGGNITNAKYINEVDFTNITVIGNNVIWEIVF